MSLFDFIIITALLYASAYALTSNGTFHHHISEINLDFEIRDLESNLSYFQTDASFWTITNKIITSSTSQCSGTWLLGGYQVTTYGETYTRTYLSVPSHSVIYFSIEIWLINLQSSGNVFRLYFDTQSVSTWDVSSLSGLLSGGGTCSESGTSYQTTTVKGVAMHSASSLIVKIQSLSSSSQIVSLGIRSINLLFGSSSSHGSTWACDYTSTVLSGSCLCSKDKYAIGSFACLSCKTNCATCIAFSSNDCTSCTSGGSFNGQACFQCDSSCYQCKNTAKTDCIRCPPNSYLYKDGTCLSRCISPLVNITEGEYLSCVFPCNNTNPFLYTNNTCLSSCSFPFVQFTNSDGTYCNFTCGVSNFLYWNGSCKSSCAFPLVSRAQGVAKFCDLPCPSGDFYYTNNNTCQFTCLTPLVQTLQGDLKLCNLLCPTSQYLNWDGSCVASCPSSFQSANGSVASCLFHCPLSNYLYWNNTCQSSCLAPLKPTNDSQSYKSCSKPCQDGDHLYPNGSCSSFCNFTTRNSADGVSSCIYPCNSSQYLYKDGTCQSYCENPHIIAKVDTYLNRCDSPCLSTWYYDEEISSCIPQCKSSSSIVTSEDVKICKSSGGNMKPSLASETSRTIASYTAYASSVFRSSSPHSVFMISLTKLLKYVKFSKARIPDEYRIILDSNKSSVFSISTAFGYDMPASLQARAHKYELPSVFQDLGYHSSYLINFWQAISTFSILIALGITFYFLEKVALKLSKEKLALILQRFAILTRWNFLLIIVFNTYDDMTLFAIFELQTLHLNSFIAVISFVVCMLITLTSIYFLVKLYRISRILTQCTSDVVPIVHESSMKKVQEFDERWSSYQVFYSGYKSSSFLKQSCLLLQTLRIIFYYLIVALLYDYPLAQSVLLTVVSLIMLSYFIKQKPFKDNFNLFVTLIFELLILVVNFCLFSLALLDMSNKLTHSTQILLSEIIVICNSIVDTLGNILTWLYVVLGVWTLFKATRSRSCGLRGKLTWLNLLIVMYEGPGMDLEIEPYIKDLRSAKEAASANGSDQGYYGQKENTKDIKNDFIIHSNSNREDCGSTRPSRFNRSTVSIYHRRYSRARTSSHMIKNREENDSNLEVNSTYKNNNQNNELTKDDDLIENRSILNPLKDLVTSRACREVSSHHKSNGTESLLTQQMFCFSPKSQHNEGSTSTFKSFSPFQALIRKRTNFSRINSFKEGGIGEDIVLGNTDKEKQKTLSHIYLNHPYDTQRSIMNSNMSPKNNLAAVHHLSRMRYYARNRHHYQKSYLLHDAIPRRSMSQIFNKLKSIKISDLRLLI